MKAARPFPAAASGFRCKICAALLLAGCSIAGCSGVTEDVTSITDVRHVELDGLSYRIMENAEQKTVTTTPPLGASLKGGLINGLALGMANVLPGREAHLRAARKYLDETGRKACPISKGRLVVEPRYRFTYACPVAEGDASEAEATGKDIPEIEWVSPR
ncbi:hypothetical protein [uncultured Cohaesibacter sp.]|uniref:hypothetical protein n=1 Tax=uncultured Cohaesibacter sp. TaxID=1002546 RepID=UPI0029C7D736|nr:hypothetical protein [uncultured Cohaesibacter sp.]